MTTKEAFDAYLKALEKEKLASNKAVLAYSIYAQLKAVNQI